MWENYNHSNNIILTEKMQQMEDIQYGYILENLRTEKNYDSNFELLKTKFLSKF